MNLMITSHTIQSILEGGEPHTTVNCGRVDFGVLDNGPCATTLTVTRHALHRVLTVILCGKTKPYIGQVRKNYDLVCNKTRKPLPFALA